MMRTFRKSDWKTMRPLVMEQWDERYAYDAVSYEKLDPWYYEDVFFKKPYQILVYQDDDKSIIGYIILKLDKVDIEVIYLYISRQKRRMGLGEALMKYAETWGKVHKYKNIWMWSITQNTRTNTMKEKLGYKFEMREYIASKKL